MRGVIYVDILFFVNALIGYFLLRGAALLAGRIAADWRIFLGAAAVGGKNRQRGAHRIRQLPGAQCARLPEMLLLVCVSEHCAFRRGICGYILWCGAECQHQ